jgi:hypothetical protein
MLIFQMKKEYCVAEKDYKEEVHINLMEEGMKRSMRLMGFGWVLLAAAVLAGGCGPTMYQRAGVLGGGYADKPGQTPGQYEIDFVGQGRSFDFVKFAAYYHAAEVAYNNNFRYFLVMKADDMTQTVWVPNGGAVPPSTTTTPGIILHIQCFTQRPPQACYDAYQYLNSVKVPATDAPYTVEQRKADQLAGKYNP